MSFTFEGHGYHYLTITGIIDGLVDHERKSELWRRAAVGCCIVDGWVDHWCTDVSWVWRIPNRNVAASNTTSTYVTTCCYITETPNNYTTKAPEYYTTTYAAPAYYTEAPITSTPEHRRTTLQPTLP
ncbi:hypothetical protein DAPPUDRAFT_236590 [Daphnia pulex]|uniref:Uncharacterized protein n=1 Tax=Daphnia pulex TaxID=6669 RepID=E9G1C7_DAPPU|nr:hypothetical protein DAPPUDRAFT_236590 [Daphnia pulex]|eukprot:EFX86658.1 hypothetical protein DAPPUDRAFT_236590 [Daphnia pulex]